jgi:hypothetical protein
MEGRDYVEGSYLLNDTVQPLPYVVKVPRECQNYFFLPYHIFFPGWASYSYFFAITRRFIILINELI